MSTPLKGLSTLFEDMHLKKIRWSSFDPKASYGHGGRDSLPYFPFYYVCLHFIFPRHDHSSLQRLFQLFNLHNHFHHSFQYTIRLDCLYSLYCTCSSNFYSHSRLMSVFFTQFLTIISSLHFIFFLCDVCHELPSFFELAGFFFF